MPTIPLHPPSPTRTAPCPPPENLPGLLHTPLGLALLELQGSFNYPTPNPDALSFTKPTTLGRLEFPDYSPSRDGAGEGEWMKQVMLYVGHQKLRGEVKKLKKPVGVVARREEGKGGEIRDVDMEAGEERGRDNEPEQGKEELEILEVVRWKIVFTSRPEPVGVEEVV